MVQLRVKNFNGLFIIEAEHGTSWKEVMALTGEQALHLSYNLKDAVTEDLDRWNARLDDIKKVYEPKQAREGQREGGDPSDNR